MRVTRPKKRALSKAMVMAVVKTKFYVAVAHCEARLVRDNFTCDEVDTYQSVLAVIGLRNGKYIHFCK